MSEYQDKLASRKAYYEAKSEKCKKLSNGAYEASRRETQHIPMGQPILIGHHSEKRHRNALKRSDAGMRKSLELESKAKYYADKAASVGMGGISSDDKDAVRQLEQKLSKCERTQDFMREANKIVRSKNINDKVAAIVTVAKTFGVTLDSSAAEKLFKPDFAGRIGFADYQLTNNSANIRRLKQRIRQLKAVATSEPAKDAEYEGFTISENIDDNRIHIVFEEKPESNVRQILKQHGFKWSPNRSAWVRMLNANGKYSAKLVAQKLHKKEA